MSALRDRFAPVVLYPDNEVKVFQIADLLTYAAEELDRLLPEGRDKSLAMTKLEECKLWAASAIAAGQQR